MFDFPYLFLVSRLLVPVVLKLLVLKDGEWMVVKLAGTIYLESGVAEAVFTIMPTWLVHGAIHESDRFSVPFFGEEVQQAVLLVVMNSEKHDVRHPHCSSLWRTERHRGARLHQHWLQKTTARSNGALP